MYLLWADSRWEVRTPAKLNLLLEVLARRDDRFHEIETLIVPVCLFDTLHFSACTSGEIELTCQWADGSAVDSAPKSVACRGDVPGGDDNLVLRAVRLLQERSSTVHGARMRLVKRIPSAAGMGGGSSDAAAALRVASTAWRLNWPLDRLRDLAAELGSDVPFFLSSRGVAAICRGRGEIVEPIEELSALHFAVVRPFEGLKTADVFAACEPSKKPKSVRSLVDALRCGQLARAGRLIHNSLQAAAETMSPVIQHLRLEFERLDCLGHQLSGSGTSYFGLCRSARHARCVAKKLRVKGVGRAFAISSCGFVM